MNNSPEFLFRLQVDAALAKLPLMTPAGQVFPEQVPGTFRHAPVMAWVYRHNGDPMEFLFGFYSNFSYHDLSCKVVLPGETEEPPWATIQFNGKRSVRSAGHAFELWHKGEITVGRGGRILEHVLRQEMLRHAAAEWALLSKAAPKWPFKVGSTADFFSLLDKLFVYALCIEQAKRSINGSQLLPSINAGVENRLVETAGSGFQPNVEKRQAVERAAMRQVTSYYLTMGYEVEDVSSDDRGWDLEATHSGDKLLVEVKGRSNSNVSAELTPGEYWAMNQYPEIFRLVIVTDALGESQLFEFRHEEDSASWKDQLDNTLRIDLQTAARVRV